MYLTRHMMKIIANKSLLKYQRLLLDKKPNVNSETRLLALANASRKLTAWSRLVAIETARWDASRAYDSDGYDIPIDDVIEHAANIIIATSPFSDVGTTEKRRRRHQREQEQERHHVSMRRVTLEDEAHAKRRRKVDENV